MKFSNILVTGLLFAAGPLFGRLDQQKVNKWAYDEKATTWTPTSYQEKIDYINANFKGNENTLIPIKKAIEDKWAKKLAADKKAADALAKKMAEEKKAAVEAANAKRKKLEDEAKAAAELAKEKYIKALDALLNQTTEQAKLAAETRAAEAKLKADQEQIAKKEKEAREAEVTRKKLEQEKAAQEKIDQQKAEQEKIKKELIAAQEKRDQDQKDLYAKIEKEREEAHKTLVSSFELIINQIKEEQIKDVRSLKTELAKTDANLNVLPRDAQRPYTLLKKTMEALFDKNDRSYATLRGDFDALEEVRTDTKKLALQLDKAKKALADAKEAAEQKRKEDQQRRADEAAQEEKDKKEAAAKEQEEKERKREERENVERREQETTAKDIQEQAEARAQEQEDLQSYGF